MISGERGIWTTADDVPAGTDYKLVINGHAWPDPASHFQPEGPHGPSRTVDHSTFKWTDEGFQQKPLSQAVIYELHIGTFTPEGTCEAAIEKLPYLKDLGITHIQVMPVAQTSGGWNWGYDGVALSSPNKAYGTPDKLKSLVNAAHGQDMAMILDSVYNHRGSEGNYTGLYGPYENPKMHTPWGAAINFDQKGSDFVRKDMIDNATMWMRDYHFDGLRLDATHELHDKSAVHILEELGTKTRKLAGELGRPLIVYVENDQSSPNLVRPLKKGGMGMDAAFMDDFHHALHTNMTGEHLGYYKDFAGTLGELAVTLQDAALYQGQYSPNRDRVHGRSYKGVDPSTQIVCIQNHDQVGNRAKGERLGHLVDDGLAKVAPAMVILSRFTPFLFMGEEFNASSPFQFFSDHRDPVIAKATTEGRQSEFGDFGWQPHQVPDPQAKSTFENSKLKWFELADEPHKTMHEWYKALIGLRRSIDGFGESKSAKVSFNEEAGWIRMSHSGVTVLANMSTENRAVPFKAGSPGVILASEGYDMSKTHVTMPPHSAVVIVEPGVSRDYRQETIRVFSAEASSPSIADAKMQLKLDAGAAKAVPAQQAPTAGNA